MQVEWLFYQDLGPHSHSATVLVPFVPSGLPQEIIGKNQFSLLWPGKSRKTGMFGSPCVCWVTISVLLLYIWMQKMICWMLAFLSLKPGAWDCFGYWCQAVGNKLWRTRIFMAPIPMMRRPATWKNLLRSYLHIVKTKFELRIHEAFWGSFP